MKGNPRRLEPSAIALVEESVHLLRTAPNSSLLIYYAGAVPFTLGFLLFWSHTTWFQPGAATLAWGALGLVGLFAAMKAAQAEFCARLLAQRLGAPPPAWSWRRLARIAAAQLRLQPWALFALPIAALMAVPLAWVVAYAQNLSVLGEGERLHREAADQAKLWPGQNHTGLFVVAALALVAWLNLGATFLLVPWLANRLLGIENAFGLSGWWFFNTTFVAAVSLLTWLAVDPLVKAFYTLRVFHGRARRTGEDLRMELHGARRRGSLAAAGRLAVVAALLAWPATDLSAAERPPVPRSSVQPAELDRAIDVVLAGQDFRWRLRPPPVSDARTEDGPVKRFARQGFETLREIARAVGRWGKKASDWIDRTFRSERAAPETSRPGSGAAAKDILRLALYAFIAAAVGLILWVIWLVGREARRSKAPVVAAQAVPAVAPDLRDEDVQAAQLPVEGWLALAREQLDRGEWRLALRAAYLATLAQLAAEGLVSLARFKTNLDYEREVRRRALSRTEVAGRFSARRREYEGVWYGRDAAGEAQVRAWLAELERRATA
jgi:hypothetical protein